ncbi:type IV secretory system conjugative DNA transfer family protein [Kitasatospora sp. NPDC048194]|uniref:type IV secretory system conjugative DNA transfer family protein n=1 Tax=Kitasatospora sp. NPDC048194 TaxID=3364045 RepID=UPI003723DC1F
MGVFGWSHSHPRILLGTYRSHYVFPRTLSLTPEQARVHTHVLGKTGSGKSCFLASMFLALHRAGMPATLIDPHGDLARLVLTHLVAEGALRTPAQRSRLLYLDIPRAASVGRFLPFNVLAQPYDDHAMAEHIAEAARRAWPELAHGAPTFENILKHSVIALRQAGLPLTKLSDLLVDPVLRTTVLARVTDPQVVRFFRLRVDQWGRDAPLMKESTLNRADLLTLSPVLRFALGHQDNALDFRRILDEGQSLIINLALPSPDVRRLFGCLLTVGMEAAALSRASMGITRPRVSHHLFLDEFSQFMAQSEESLTRMLSETRKYSLFCVMAHQNWSQASDRLKGALQNVGLEVILKAGRPDAEYSARMFGTVDPDEVKHTVSDEAAEERTHPAYRPLQEQWERQVQWVQQLHTGQAYVRLPDDTVQKVRTPTLPHLDVNPAEVTAVEDDYLTRLFHPAPEAGTISSPPPISRRRMHEEVQEFTTPRTVFPRPLVKADRKRFGD